MKILISGDVEGNIKAFFGKVQGVLTKSGPFDMLLCVGSFFANTSACREEWARYVDGKEQVPLATYILGPTSSEQVPFYGGLSLDGGELCPNLTCLGQRGLFTSSSGLQIAYLSGGEYSSSQSKTSALSGKFGDDDVEALLSMANGKDFLGVDIFLTSDWPRGVENYTTLPPEVEKVKGQGAEAISRLAARLRPRYHFCGKHRAFFERVPYRNHQVLQGEQRHVTRFIALAQFGNPDKKHRHVYAFSISPLTSLDRRELTQQPPAVTDFPYGDVLKAHLQQQSSAMLDEQNFFFDPKSLEDGRKRKDRSQRPFQQEGPMTKRRPQQGDQPNFQDSDNPPANRRPIIKQPVPRGPCWFCLGSPEVEKHLIISIGDQSYLALPKGGLISEHVLILPIGHYGASTDAPEEVLEEMAKFKDSLRRYFKSKDQSCVIFERNFKSPHLQLQVIPVPDTPADTLRQAFIGFGETQGLEFTELPRDVPLTQVAQVGAPYFVAEFDDGPSLFVKIKGRFSLQFGREVLASPLLLNIPDRVDWKACSTSKEEETQAAKAFRKTFQPYDFTNN
ncbi:hypothetical protein EMCRGX_G023536 [Ephydatia muelleri]|eukprot:Em0017g187a